MAHWAGHTNPWCEPNCLSEITVFCFASCPFKYNVNASRSPIASRICGNPVDPASLYIDPANEPCISMEQFRSHATSALSVSKIWNTRNQATVAEPAFVPPHSLILDDPSCQTLLKDTDVTFGWTQAAAMAFMGAPWRMVRGHGEGRRSDTGYVGGSNRVISGLMVKQTRFARVSEEKDCSSASSFLRAWYPHCTHCTHTALTVPTLHSLYPHCMLSIVLVLTMHALYSTSTHYACSL
jgi:hypothetical protein